MISHFHAQRTDDQSAVIHERQGRIHEGLVSLFFAGRRRAVYTQLAILSGAQSGDRVLDVGCGSGYLSRIMAKTVGPEGTVLAVDASKEAIESARRLTRLPNCTFSIGTAEALADPDDTYDVVVTSLMIHHLPESVRTQAAREMLRVLRPRGRLLIAEFRPPTSRVGGLLIHPFTSSAMQHNPLGLLEPMLDEAGFECRGSGDLRPWIRYVQALKPGR